MYQNPALVQALVRDRVAELFQSAPPARGHRGNPKRRLRMIRAARQGTGWVLVDLGLRLAIPRGAVNHPSA